MVGEDWEGGANEWRGAGGPIHIRRPGDPHPTAPAFLEAAKQMGFPILDDAAAGVDASLDVWMGMPHGFAGSIGTLKASARALDAIGAFLTEKLRRV